MTSGEKTKLTPDEARAGERHNRFWLIAGIGVSVALVAIAALAMG